VLKNKNDYLKTTVPRRPLFSFMGYAHSDKAYLAGVVWSTPNHPKLTTFERQFFNIYCNEA